MVQLVEDQLDIDTYMELRAAVNFPKLSRDQARRGLDNSLYTLVAFKDGKAVGMGRIVGDGAIICYVQDLIIRPEVQGGGHRRAHSGKPPVLRGKYRLSGDHDDVRPDVRQRQGTFLQKTRVYRPAD